MREVTDLSAPELMIYSKLTENELKHYYEPRGGLFMAESPVVILRALEAGYEPESLLLEEGLEEREEMRVEYEQRRNVIVKGFNDLGLKCSMPRGAFYVFPSIRCTGLSSEEFCSQLLQEKDVAAVPGTAFGPSGEGNIRCCYATAIDKINIAGADGYKKQVEEAVKTVLIPAFNKIIAMYEPLKGKSVTNGRLCEYGDLGDRTYDVIVRLKTSSTQSIPDMIELMDDAIFECLNGIYDVMNEVEITDGYGYSDPREILEYLKSLCS